MFVMQDGDIYIDGTYTFPSKNKIQLNVPQMNMDLGFLGEISIEHNTLTISNISAVDNRVNMMSDCLTFDLIK